MKNIDNEKIKEKCFEYYWTTRSAEFLKQCDKHTAWIRLNKRIQKRIIHRRLTQAAAIIILLLIPTTILYITTGREKEISSNTSHIIASNAGTQKAILILSDGEKIDLSQKAGEIFSEKNYTNIFNDGQELQYKNSKSKQVSDTLTHNTLIIPRGGEYRIQLSDGTKVWLNAESRLDYPELFPNNTRTVTLQGEAYFEVAKDSSRPFLVKVREHTIKVLGTHFNISNYDDCSIYTTLVEGSVCICSEGENIVLKPHEQAIISPSGIKIETVDASLYTSWIYGKYIFRNTSLKEVISQISRWYDINIYFSDENLQNKYIAGAISRYEKLDLILQVIERVAKVRFLSKNGALYIEEEK